MKELGVSVLILLVASLSLADSSTGAQEESSQAATDAQPASPAEKPVQKTSAEPNAAADPNAGEVTAEELAELDRALVRIGRDSRDEEREWTRNTGENRVNLAKAVHRQIEAELNFIGKVAAEEGCGRTSAAIERLLALRLERFTKVIAEMEKKSPRRSRRMEQRTEEQSIDPLGRGRGRDSDLRNMSSEERRRAWEQRRREQRERRLQERQAQRERAPQENTPDY